ncbi:MAG: ABC transporter ATP-binding protein [Eubacteriaceae bacterium]|jgi:iron complex transport system ATP-binding protein|nr:ABC transporter ATP-binding protein [Eubacteriaceae bacterium]
MSDSIQVKDLSFAYPDGQVVFSGINLKVEAGQILSLLGPNGIGKTTLLNCMFGLLAPKTGDIYLNGNGINTIERNEVAKIISYVPQTIRPSFDYTVLDYVVTGCAPKIGLFKKPEEKHYDAARQAIKKLGITHLEQASYLNISGGERQQVLIARVLAQNARFIFMDEPTAHLDYGNQLMILRIMKELSEEGYGIIATTHNPDHVIMLGGMVGILDREKKFTVGSVEDVINEDMLCKLYNARLRVDYFPEIERKACVAQRI